MRTPPNFWRSEKAHDVAPKRPIFALKIIDIFLRLGVLIFFYFLINFDTQFNLDYTTYKNNYDLQWRQFEPGFEAVLDIFRILNVPFSDVWTYLIIIEVVLLAFVFRKRIEFYLAIPNIYFLSQGLLGTQVRFAIATLLFIFIFRSISSKKIKTALLAATITLHFGMIITYAQSIFLYFLLNLNSTLLSRKNLFSIAVFSLAALLVTSALDTLLVNFGYGYYVGTKFQEGKSLQSMAYISASLITLCLLAKHRQDRENAAIVYFAILITVSALIISESSVIAGRLTLVYVLIEPIIMAIIYEKFGSKRRNFPVFVVYCTAIFAKAFTVSVIL